MSWKDHPQRIAKLRERLAAATAEKEHWQRSFVEAAAYVYALEARVAELQAAQKGAQ